MASFRERTTKTEPTRKGPKGDVMTTESDRDALAEEMFDAWQGPGSWGDAADYWRDEFRGRADSIISSAWLAGHDKRVAAKIRESADG